MADIEASGGTVHWLHRGPVRLRAASWPGDRSRVALLLHGRTEFMEKYLETVGLLRERGFAVWSLDWRGQGRSARLLPDTVRNHVGSFDDHLADLDAIYDMMPAGPLLVLGQSMGGHLALRWAARRPGAVARLALAAPMIDFPRPHRMPLAAALVLSAAACAVPGLAGRFGPGTRPVPDRHRAFAGNPLTSCPRRFAADHGWLDDPGLVVGGATWGWLRAATASIAAMRRPGFARDLRLPVLMALSGADRVVDNAAARRLAARLPDVRVVEIAGARHELLRESDAIQAEFWAAFDAFAG